MFFSTIFQLFTLILGKHLVEADLGGVHLSRNLGLKSGLAVEERIERPGLVAILLHKHTNAVAYCLLLVAETLDAFLGFVGDGLELALLRRSKVTDNLGNLRMFLSTMTMWASTVRTLG